MDAQTQATEIGARWFEVSSLTEGKVEFLMNKILRDLLDRNMPVALEKEGLVFSIIVITIHYPTHLGHNQ